MRKVQNTSVKSKRNNVSPFVLPDDFNMKIETIQALIPLGLAAVADLLQGEVAHLAGDRYQRGDGNADIVRWGKNNGSIYLSDRKVPIEVPRVRDRSRNREIALTSYQKLQQPYQTDMELLRKVLLGISCHKYKDAAALVPEVFGISPSTVSRRFIRSSEKKLEEFNTRQLEPYDITALIIDGKTFAEDQMIIALGVTIQGEKALLGFIQAATENASVCAAFLRSLIERGLSYKQGILCVIDGAKGIRKAIADVFGNYACVQRCQWHKRENVVSYLPKSKQTEMRKRLQRAYEQPTYEKASAALMTIKRDLKILNISAVNSLEEGLEETLTLHRLGVFSELGVSLKTTNCLESINAQLTGLLGRVKRWQTSDQKHRWLASALLAIEPNLRKIKGYNALGKLRNALQNTLELKHVNVA